MSDSIKDSAAQDAEVVSGGNASLTTRAETKSPSVAKSRESAPKSSPPVVADGDLPAHNAAAAEQKPSAQDDGNESEAETLISSPVKKREAAKRANGVKTEPTGSSDNSNPPSDAIKVDGDNLESTNTSNVNVLVKQDQTDADNEAENGVADHANGIESDGSSEVSSVRSSSIESKASSESGDEGEKEADERRNGHEMRNPRKRKHRASSSHKQTSMEPPRRRRRGSTNAPDNGQDDERSSEERSPPPRLRSHRRTASAQATSAEGGIEGGTTSGSGRKRRAASHFPVQEAKNSKPAWESDTSSESHQHPQNRLTRSINRSVSTPGRTMAREHKRHVNKYGFTRLAEACETGDLDLVKEWREKDPEQLEQREFAGNTPLQVASLNGFPDIVQYLLDQGCSAHCANTDKDTPLIDAVENGHIDVVRLLLKAGVDPMRNNMKGQQALDVITDQTEYGPEIRAILRQAIEAWVAKGAGKQAEREEETGHRPGPTKGLQFMARTYDNLMKLVTDNDRSGVQEFLDARVPVDNDVVAAAAKTGDLYLVNMLLAEMTPKKARSRAEKPMLAVIGTSHYEMVKTLTELEQFNPTWRSKSNGLTWYELAEHRQGPNWRRERQLLHQLYNDCLANNRLSSSPVSKREGAMRRPKHRDSDEEMEDGDSPDLSKNRRRLMSRKDMRAASRRRSSSSSRSPSTSPSRENAARSADHKPPPRKVGRPRTKSMSSHVSEPHPKRLRSSSFRERPPLFDSPQGPNGNTSGRRRSEDRYRQDNVIEEEVEEVVHPQLKSEADANLQADAEERERAEADARQKARAEAEAKAKAEAQIKMEEQRKAEEARKEEEEAARLKERERLQLEQEAANERFIKRQQLMETLPSALKHVLSLGDDQGTKRATYVARHFTPIQAARGAVIRPAETLGQDDEAWMLSYQAAGILTGEAADFLLDLPVAGEHTHAFASASTLPVSDQHRRMLLASLGSSSLVHQLPFGSENDSESIESMFAAAERAFHAVQVDRAKFLSMPNLRWIRCREFFEVKTALQYPHLEHVAFELEFDSSLDPTPFDEVQPTTNGHPMLTNGEANGGDDHKADVFGSLIKDCHGKVERGQTKISVVVD